MAEKEEQMQDGDPKFDDQAVGDMLMTAWGLIANASYWDRSDAKRSGEWLEARQRWRDEQFHPWLAAHAPIVVTNLEPSP